MAVVGLRSQRHQALPLPVLWSVVVSPVIKARTVVTMVIWFGLSVHCLSASLSLNCSVQAGILLCCAVFGIETK